MSEKRKKRKEKDKPEKGRSVRCGAHPRVRREATSHHITSQAQAGKGGCPRARGGRRHRVAEEGWGATQHVAKGRVGETCETKGKSANEREKENDKKMY